MKKRYLSILCGAALLCGATAVSAKEGTPAPQGPRPEQMQKMEDDLATKLKLTDEQRAKAHQIHQEGRAHMKKMHEEMQAARKANMAEFEKILTPEQKKEFDKIKTEHEHMRKFRRPGKDGLKGRPDHKGRHEGVKAHWAPVADDGELPPPPPPAEEK